MSIDNKIQSNKTGIAKLEYYLFACLIIPHHHQQIGHKWSRVGN